MSKPESRSDSAEGLVALGTDHPIWDRFFQVFPLVVVGSKEPDGSFDLAPKHMAMPMGWENRFGFVCTPRHATYANVRREGVFTVSFPRPSQVLFASLASAPRCEEDTKPALQLLQTRPATVVDGVLLDDAYLHFECEIDRIIDDFGVNSLITGRIVEALVTEDALRDEDRDDADVLAASPLLTYVAPGRYAEISDTLAFPFHAGWSR